MYCFKISVGISLNLEIRFIVREDPQVNQVNTKIPWMDSNIAFLFIVAKFNHNLL